MSIGNTDSSLFGRFLRRPSSTQRTQDDRVLARFDFVITFGVNYQREFRDSYDERLTNIVFHLQESLTTEFEKFVRDLMGDEVSVRIDKLEKGSIVGTITLLLVSAISAYTYVSQYHDFVESLNLIRNQLHNRITRVLAQGDNLWDTNINVIITRVPIGQANYRPDSPISNYSSGFFWYLFVSNIVLVIILGLLLLKAVTSVYFGP